MEEASLRRQLIWFCVVGSAASCTTFGLRNRGGSCALAGGPALALPLGGLPCGSHRPSSRLLLVSPLFHPSRSLESLLRRALAGLGVRDTVDRWDGGELFLLKTLVCLKGEGTRLRVGEVRREFGPDLTLSGEFPLLLLAGELPRDHRPRLYPPRCGELPRDPPPRPRPRLPPDPPPRLDHVLYRPSLGSESPRLAGSSRF